MNYNICLIRPDGYIHSDAFVELAQLIGHGLEDLGHSVAISANDFFLGATNIIIGCHLMDAAMIGQVPKRSIVINTEQISDDETAWNSDIFKWTASFETWDYSEKNVSRLHRMGAGNTKLLRLGFHPKLARIPKAGRQDIDVLFYGSMGERREKVIAGLKAAGCNTHAVFGIYGAERDKLIARSKVVLNMHHYNSRIFEIVRVFYLLTNSKAVVGEVSENTEIDPRYVEGIFRSPYEDLVKSCKLVVEDDQLRAELESKALKAIQAHRQSEFLRPLL